MNVKLNAYTKPAGGMSPEEYLIYCARVSSPENRLNHDTAPKLLKYLIDSGHWSPFEMISFAFEIETSRAIAQQILRHRSFSFQEFSQRYAEVDTIEDVELRYQAVKNRQSSTDIVGDEKQGLNFSVNDHMENCLQLYRYLISQGVAKECARMVLPLATQTTIVMHGTLRSWIHFLGQRCDHHAQKEIRLIAEEVKSQLSGCIPWTAAAFGWTE